MTQHNNFSFLYPDDNQHTLVQGYPTYLSRVIVSGYLSYNQIDSDHGLLSPIFLIKIRFLKNGLTRAMNRQMHLNLS